MIKNLQFFRIPVQSLQQHILKVFIMRKNEEANTEYSVNLCTKILEVDIREVFYLELHARRDEDLLHVSIYIEHTEALFYAVDLLGVLALQELHWLRLYLLWGKCDINRYKR